MSAEQQTVTAAAPGEVRIARALLSVSDKRGIEQFAAALAALGVELVSTGGTARALSAAGLEVRSIEEFTGFPEMMDGRVKTLHPRLYAGLLALRDDDGHLAAAAEHGIEPVDLVCVNLYPFEQTVARGDAGDEEIIENIDIGGPTMIRAAAKNSQFAAVVVDPDDYAGLAEELAAHDGRLSLATRSRLAAKAFATTARYDAAIATWLAGREDEPLPAGRFETYERLRELRYGENPHQQAAFYARAGAELHLLSGVSQLHGKELSFNNLLDLSAARELAEEFDEPACAIVKHNNPCGCALAADVHGAYLAALACDPQSAYGGVIAVNRPVDEQFARALEGHFVEVLLAPGYDEAALAVLREKKNARLLELPAWPRVRPALESKAVLGGALVQTRDAADEGRAAMTVASAREPSEGEWRDMLFAWRVCRHVRSNAIVIAAGDATIGIGAGQMSRVDAVRIAVEKAREFRPEQLPGSALASDAFFPFADGPQIALDAGVAAIVQPGGSVRDADTAAAVDAAGAAMVTTGIRHFRH